MLRGRAAGFFCARLAWSRSPSEARLPCRLFLRFHHEVTSSSCLPGAKITASSRAGLREGPPPSFGSDPPPRVHSPESSPSRIFGGVFSPWGAGFSLNPCASRGRLVQLHTRLVAFTRLVHDSSKPLMSGPPNRCKTRSRLPSIAPPRPCRQGADGDFLTYSHIGIYSPMPRAATTLAPSTPSPNRADARSSLSSRPRSPVGESCRVGLAQPSVSKHLGVLRDVGLVHVRRDGRQILYRTNADAIRPIHEWTSCLSAIGATNSPHQGARRAGARRSEKDEKQS